MPHELSATPRTRESNVEKGVVCVRWSQSYSATRAKQKQKILVSQSPIELPEKITIILTPFPIVHSSNPSVRDLLRRTYQSQELLVARPSTPPRVLKVHLWHVRELYDTDSRPRLLQYRRTGQRRSRSKLVERATLHDVG
jgi:hypothetical protein